MAKDPLGHQGMMSFQKVCEKGFHEKVLTGGNEVWLQKAEKGNKGNETTPRS